jgi:capsular exopolysaccharide synthesis family protein
VNLAIAAARSGMAVLLVDCDLRRPSIHQQLGLTNDAGFTSVFLGEPVENVMQSVPGIDNLTVLTSGPLPPNPSELLTSTRGREVLKSLSSTDALVLFDTPPLLGLNDAAAVAANVDAALLVVMAESSTRRSLRGALDLLAQIGVPTLGTVLTRAKDDTTAGSYAYADRTSRRLKRSTGEEPEREAGG